MTFADKLVDLRKKQGLSQQELADKLNVSEQTISEWESETSAPELQDIVRISEVFGVTTDYLLKEDAEECSVADVMDRECSGEKLTTEQTREYLKNRQVHVQAYARAAGLFMFGLFLLCVMTTCLWMESHTLRYIATVGIPVALLCTGIAVLLWKKKKDKLTRTDESVTYDELSEEGRQYMFETLEQCRKPYQNKLVLWTVIGMVTLVPIFVGCILWEIGFMVCGAITAVLTALVVYPVTCIGKQWDVSFRLTAPESYDYARHISTKYNKICYIAAPIVIVLYVLIAVITQSDAEMYWKLIPSWIVVCLISPIYMRMRIYSYQMYYGVDYLERRYKRK